jgi:site-specific DNA-cytosine methylase
LELFAGAGGLAIGLENAGLKCTALNEIDKWACNTLRTNRPNWEVLEGDIRNFDFSECHNKIDIVTGGFPCLTLTYSPAQKQTERCQPDETRPFTVREYARIQPSRIIGLSKDQ